MNKCVKRRIAFKTNKKNALKHKICMQNRPKKVLNTLKLYDKKKQHKPKRIQNADREPKKNIKLKLSKIKTYFFCFCLDNSFLMCVNRTN